MKASEIRIGNWIHRNDTNQDTQLNQSYLLDNEDNLQPIPLTKEWIIGFGFTEAWEGANDILIAPDTNMDEYGRLSIEPIVRIESESIFYGDIHCCEISYWKKVEFVHELQNYHYFNTGKELIVVPKSH
tara:strand:- start:1498 stop:1884 length:387 start_codon:yes stop_codon:yes gene_type:complete